MVWMLSPSAQHRRPWISKKLTPFTATRSILRTEHNLIAVLPKPQCIAVPILRDYTAELPVDAAIGLSSAHSVAHLCFQSRIYECRATMRCGATGVVQPAHWHRH